MWADVWDKATTDEHDGWCISWANEHLPCDCHLSLLRGLLDDADALLTVVDVERLAEIEHAQWMAWARTLMDEEPGLSQERRERWQDMMVPFDKLSDEIKEYDREWARIVRAALPEHLKAP